MTAALGAEKSLDMLITDSPSDVIMIKADVTKNSPSERLLQEHLAVFGPPALVFFKDGQETSRLVGEVTKTQFLAHINSLPH